MKFKDISFWIYIWAAVIFTVGIIILNFSYFIDEKNYELRGTFGDMFGGANALFTGLSFIGIIVTILLQRQDMNNQRKLANIQAFENTFFNLLNRHHEIVLNSEKQITNRTNRGGKITVSKFTRKGTDVFQTIYSTLVHVLKHHGEFSDNVNNLVYKAHWDVLGHYYRSLELIIKMVHDNETLTYWEKCKYIDILKAQLSEYETAMVFYHFLGEKKTLYKMISEEYTLFEFINLDLVTDDVLSYKGSARFRY